ncbi:MAG: hypothetical protein ABI609_14575 [Acidobacteriota bacterium]
MRRRFIAASALALVALGFAVGLQRFPASTPLGDEATEALKIASLWHDHDLRVDAADLDRSYLTFHSGPEGLVLTSTDGGVTRRFAGPIAFTLLALPWYAVFGFKGVVFFNALLILGAAALAWRLRDGAGDAGGLFAVGFVLGSAALGYALRLGAHGFEFTCAFAALGLWWRERRLTNGRWSRWILVGTLLGVLVHQEPMAASVAAAVLIDLLFRQRAANWATLVGALALSWALLGAGQSRLAGQSFAEWRSGATEVRVFFDAGSLDRGLDGFSEGVSLNGLRGFHALERQPRVVARNLGYLLMGRNCGMLAFYPFAVAALLMFVLGPRDRVRWLLVAAFGAGMLGLALLRTEAWSAPIGDLGFTRLAGLVPALFFLPAGAVRRRWLMLAAVAAGFWVLPASLPRFERAGHAAAPSWSRSALPTELTLLGAHRLEAYGARSQGDLTWWLPKRELFLEENRSHGLWMQGGARAEIFVVSPRALGELEFKLYSFAKDNQVRASCGRQEVSVRFDSEAKRSDGVAILLPVEPVARDLGGFFPAPSHEFYYRVLLDSSSGAIPVRTWRHNADERYLGVFLSLDGQAP